MKHLSVNLKGEDVERLKAVHAYLKEVTVVPSHVSVSDCIRYALAITVEVIRAQDGEGACAEGGGR